MGKQLFHISPDGVGKCDATVRSCKYENSYDIVELAQRYEEQMKHLALKSHTKKPKNATRGADSRAKVSGRKEAANAIRNASEAKGRANKGNEPANQNQYDFIKTLKRERVVPKEFNDEMNKLWKEQKFTHAKAFEFIRTLRTFPEKPNVVKQHESLVGYHNVQGRLIRVYRSKTGYMYVREFQFSDDSKEARSRQLKIETLKELNFNTPLSQKEAIEIDRRLLEIGEIK